MAVWGPFGRWRARQPPSLHGLTCAGSAQERFQAAQHERGAWPVTTFPACVRPFRSAIGGATINPVRTDQTSLYLSHETDGREHAHAGITNFFAAIQRGDEEAVQRLKRDIEDGRTMGSIFWGKYCHADPRLAPSAPWAFSRLPSKPVDPDQGRIEIIEEDFTFAEGKGLILVSCKTGGERAAYIEPVSVVDTLPDMPLVLTHDIHVMVPLELTYQATWDDRQSGGAAHRGRNGAGIGARSGVSGQRILVRGVSLSNSPKRNRLRAGLLQ
jgi:hypothetical protein